MGKMGEFFAEGRRSVAERTMRPFFPGFCRGRGVSLKKAFKKALQKAFKKGRGIHQKRTGIPLKKGNPLKKPSQKGQESLKKRLQREGESLKKAFKKG